MRCLKVFFYQRETGAIFFGNYFGETQHRFFGPLRARNLAEDRLRKEEHVGEICSSAAAEHHHYHKYFSLPEGHKSPLNWPP